MRVWTYNHVDSIAEKLYITCVPALTIAGYITFKNFKEKGYLNVIMLALETFSRSQCITSHVITVELKLNIFEQKIHKPK